MSNEYGEQLKKFLPDSYGITTSSCTPFETGVVNINFLCTTNQGNMVVKLYTCKTAPEIQFEIEVLQELERHAFPSPRIHKTKQNTVLSTFEDKPCLVYSFIHGKPLSPTTITPNILRGVGVIMGQLHTLTGSFTPSITKKGWDPEDLKILVRDHGSKLVEKGLPGAQLMLDYVERKLAEYHFPASLPHGVTHQDIKPENILVDEKAITGIIDFDNSYRGAFLHDITTTIIWTCLEGKQFNTILMKNFLDGYQSVRPLTNEEKDIFPQALHFRLVREIFIGPFAARDPLLAKDRSDYFMSVAQQTITPALLNGIL